MTEDPKAPGAAAVYLYREEKTDDNLHYHGFYVRIKVLAEKGKELATVHIPYERNSFKVTGIAGRTIHPDGTVIPLTTRPEDLVEMRSGTVQYNTKVFTLPSVEVGSILEYRLDLRYDDSVVSSPLWDVQQPYFVHRAHYSFAPLSTGGRYVENSRGEAADRIMYVITGNTNVKMIEDLQGRYSFDVADVPATPNEDWMPPLNTFTWKVFFFYTQYLSETEFWQKEGRRWGRDAERFTSPDKLHEAVAAIVSPADGEEQRARKIYAAVQQIDNTDFSRERSAAERRAERLREIRSAADVWAEKSGSADNLALLYVGLARAAGLTAWPMQVVDRSRAFFNAGYLSLAQLDDYIAVVVIGGKEVFLDPGQKACPFGLLHWKHTMTAGLRLGPEGASIKQTPASTYTQSSLSRVADLSIDAERNVTGTIRLVMTGNEALGWRQTALRNDPEEVKRRFNEWVRGAVPDGVRCDFDHFLALDQYESNLIAIVKVEGNIGSATGKRLFLPGLFFEAHARHPFAAEERRESPVDVQYARMEQDDVFYHLPPGSSLESSPESTNIEWSQHALLKIVSTKDGDSVRVGRVLAYNYSLLEARDYADLHGFFQKIAAADQQQLVVTRAAVAPRGSN